MPAASVTCTSVAPSSVGELAAEGERQLGGQRVERRVGGGIGRDELVVRARGRRDEQAAGREQRGGDAAASGGEERGRGVVAGIVEATLAHGIALAGACDGRVNCS